MKHINEFSKQSSNYEDNSSIQKEVSKQLLAKLMFKPKKILDLGCGTGDIYKNISWELDKFVGVDYAKGMCQKHPDNLKIKIINENFESDTFVKKVNKLSPFDLVISSSALQWANNLEYIMKHISTMTNNIAFSIFTDNTFKDIYNLSGLKIFLPNAHKTIKLVENFFDVDYEIKTYRLFFEDNISKFRYIKKSGVSGGEKKLSLEKTKKLIEEYPHDYLEFEVLYLVSKINIIK